MRRRFIALQPDSNHWRFAVAAGDQQQATLLQTGTFAQNPDTPLADLLAAQIGPLQLTDRLACPLPAHSAMIRWLEFPFSDPQKVAAASRPEMARQLPGSLEGLVSYQQLLENNQVLSVAVARESLAELIEKFDDNREPLGYIGLAPFCYSSGLAWEEDAVLLCAEQGEISLLRYANGKPVDLRILPQTSTAEIDEIVRETQLLAHGTQPSLTRLKLLGVASDSELADSLGKAGFSIEPIPLTAESGQVPAELTSTACLALAAARATTNDLNLRSGEYKLKNDWQALKRRMWLAAGLLTTMLLAVIASGYLQYQRRAGELDRLEAQMNSIYQQAFPGEKLLVPAPLQLQSKLKELQKKSSQFGTGSLGALKILQLVSQHIDPSISVDIKEYVHSDEGVRLSGTTTDFDAVSRLLANLQKESTFSEVRILDSKQAIDGSKVDFQLQIELQQGEESR